MAETPISRMHKKYGKELFQRCKTCCNCQPVNGKTVCIAFSNTVAWDPDYTACSKMYNYPFRALRPVQRPLDMI